MPELTNDQKNTIIDRHTHHAPKDEATIEAHAEVRRILAQAEIDVLALMPFPSRSASLVQTKLDEARMWANMGIATGK
jgi:hypothetical protein